MSAFASVPVQYQRLFRALPDNYLLLAPDGTVLDNSTAHEQVSLRPRQESVGRHIFEAYPTPDPEQQARLHHSQEYVRQHREPHTLALRYDLEQPVEQGGGFVVRHWELTHFPILDDDGQLLYILQRPQDVTEKVLAQERAAALEQERDEAQQFAQFVLDTMPVLVATTRPDGQADYFNPRWQEFTGRTQDELAGGRWTECVHPDDLPGMLRLRDQSVAQPNEVQYDFRLRRHDGQYRWMLGRTVPRLDAHGRLQLRVGVSLDVHEQKELVRELLEASEQQAVLSEQAYQAYQRIESQRETFYTLFNEAPALIAILKGPQHVFEFVNPRYQALFPGRQLTGLSLAEALPEVAAQGFGTLLDGVYQSGEPFLGSEVPVQVPQPDGTLQPRYFNFTYQPFREDGRTVGISVFAYDVSDLVRAHQALQPPASGPAPAA